MMQPYCHSCGQIPREWSNPWTCKSCGDGYDEFDQALEEGRVDFVIPKEPQVGDQIDVKISPRKER